MSLPSTIVAGPAITPSATPASASPNAPPPAGPSWLDAIGASDNPVTTPEPAPVAAETPAAQPKTKESTPAKPAAKAGDAKPAKTEPTNPLDALLSVEDAEQPETAAEGEEGGADNAADPNAEPPSGEKATPKERMKWGELRKLADTVPTLTQELETVKQQLAEAKKVQEAEPLRKEAEELRQKYEEAQKHLEIHNVTRSDAYIQQIEQPWTAIRASAEELATDAGLDKEAVINALVEPDKAKRRAAITELYESLPEIDRQTLLSLSNKTKELQELDVKIRTNAAEAAKEAAAREKETTEKTKLETKAAEMRAVADVGERAAKIKHLLAGENDDPDAVMAAISSKAQETPFAELSTESKGYAAWAAAALPKATAVVAAQRKQIESLKREIAGLSAGGPTPAQVAERLAPANDNKTWLQAIGAE